MPAPPAVRLASQSTKQCRLHGLLSKEKLSSTARYAETGCASSSRHVRADM